MPRIEWSPEQLAAHEKRLAQRPHFTRFNHVSIAVRDLAEAKRFYTEVLGGRLILEASAHFAEVLVAGQVIGLSDERGEAQRPETEFPHLAFETTSDGFIPMINWLEQHGVATHEPWTRHHIEGLMYFKDPSGNLIEIYCPQYAGADKLQRADTVVGVVDLTELDYEWEPAPRF